MFSHRPLLALTAFFALAGCRDALAQSTRRSPPPSRDGSSPRTDGGAGAGTVPPVDGAAPAIDPESLPAAREQGALDVVALFHGAMPTGVTVSRSGRVFVNFPRWGDAVEYTVAEIRDGQPVPYPDASMQRGDPRRAGSGLVSVQSVVVDARDRLWILDTGSVQFGPTSPGGPKLVAVDLAQNRVLRTITLPPNVALPTSYVNDVRFDLRRGAEGMAFVTDSSMNGPNGIIVVDLASGRSWRRLNDHPSTKAERGFLPFVEGEAMMTRRQGQPARHLAIGSDGIAIAHDGSRLYYCPLASRKLYSVSVDALIDPARSDADVARTVTDHGEKGASDGLESDAQGRLYVTHYEQNAILRRRPDGTFETLVHDPRVLWPDTLSLASNGYLYFIANQLHRQASYHNGRDLRTHPYVLFRVRTDGTPVSLTR